MSPSVAALIFVAFSVWLLASDIRRREGLSKALWVVVFWIALLGSRPVTSWFGESYQSGGLAQSYDEGNPIERMVYLVLIAFGLMVLRRRRVRLLQFARENRWLFVFLLYWSCSILWADSPLIAAKRWIKDAGNIVMALVVMTDARPLSAAKAVFFRCAAILAPASLLLMKYFPDQGRVYHVTGELLYTGVATHKNSLGMMLLVCGMFLVWDMFPGRRSDAARRTELSIAGVSLLALMTWLLLESKSATSIGCAAVGILTFLTFCWPPARRHATKFEVAALAFAMMAFATDLPNQILEFVVVDLFGRNLTLTTRTDFWPVLAAMSQSIAFGSGFNSFWTGERLATLFGQYQIVQAHNGYLEIYLNGGVVGLALLSMLLISATRSINRDLASHGPLGVIRMALLLITALYNITEASFNTMSILWFAFVLTTVRYSAPISAETQTLDRLHGAQSRHRQGPPGHPASTFTLGDPDAADAKVS